MKRRAAVHWVCIWWRGSKWHRSVTVATASLCFAFVSAVSRRLFILVHISSPMACRGWWLSRERAEIAALAPPLPPPSPRQVGHKDTYIFELGQQGARRQALLPWRGSQSMVVCLQREEQEHRLRENNRETAELLNSIRHSRFIAVGSPSDIQKRSGGKRRLSLTLWEVTEGDQFLWMSPSDASLSKWNAFCSSSVQLVPYGLPCRR